MKKLFIVFLLAAAVVLTAGCSKKGLSTGTASKAGNKSITENMDDSQLLKDASDNETLEMDSSIDEIEQFDEIDSFVNTNNSLSNITIDLKDIK